MGRGCRLPGGGVPTARLLRSAHRLSCALGHRAGARSGQQAQGCSCDRVRRRSPSRPLSQTCTVRARHVLVLCPSEPRRERLASHCLTLAGYEIYQPLLREQRRSHGRKNTVTPPLFPGYLFLWVVSDWWNARWAAGVRRLVMDGPQRGSRSCHRRDPFARTCCLRDGRSTAPRVGVSCAALRSRSRAEPQRGCACAFSFRRPSRI